MKGARKGLILIWYVVRAISLVPSVFWGLVGLIVLLPWAGHSFDSSRVMILFTLFLTLGLMALPTVLRMGERAIESVPRAHQQAAYALGASCWEVWTKVTLPTAWPRLFSAILMGFSQALAEFVILLMLIGAGSSRFLPAGPSGSVLSAIALGEGPLPRVPGISMGLVKLGVIMLTFFLIVRLIAGYSWKKVWCPKEGFHDRV